MHCFTSERRRFGGALGALLGVLALLWGLLPGAARAQSAPRLVRDINVTSTYSLRSDPRWITVAGKTAYFTAYHPLYGEELWKTDGTAVGTALVKDISPGMRMSRPEFFAASGSTVYFSADDDAHGPELWKSNGTAAGTTMVKEIMPDIFPSQIRDLTPVRAGMVFSANDGPHGVELWRTDGTAAGTYMLKDFDPIHSGGPRGFTSMNGVAYFMAEETIYNTYQTRPALWKSDGTAAGTARVSKLDSFIDNIATVNGRLIYSTFSYGTTGEMRHVWLSNGTEAGTRKLASIPMGRPYYSSKDGATYAAALPNGSLYFLNIDPYPNFTLSLWRSDGQGTRLVKTITPAMEIPADPYAASYSTQILALNGALYFCAPDATHGVELWKSDGTAAGTVMVKDIRPGAASANPTELTVAGGKLFFFANDGVHGWELWKSDGTAAGTAMVKDIAPASLDADDPANYWYYYYGYQMKNLREFNGKLLFSALDGTHGQEIWISDGTAAGTRMVKDIGVASNSGFENPVACGAQALYFTAHDGVHGMELWKTDGRGATLVKDMWPGPYSGLWPMSGAPANAYFTMDKVFLNNAVYFGATLGKYNAGLFRCDVATGKVTALKYGMSDLLMLAKRGNSMIFSSLGVQNYLEIWSCDGTKTGTKLLKRFSPSKDGSEGYYYYGANPPMAELKGGLYFGTPTLYHRGLWRSDGTAAGTVKISSLDSSPTSYTSLPMAMKVAGDKLFLISDDRLWVSDGTSLGTKAVRRGRDQVLADQLETMAGKAFFTKPYWYSEPQGNELWVSDGTEAGTRVLKDIWPGAPGSNPRNLLVVNNRLFFSASHPTCGNELWVSDGTAAGTRPVKDIIPGKAGSYPNFLAPAGSRVLFNAYDPQHGNELWISDGTAAGTQLACEVTPGPLGSNPLGMTLLGDTVIFNALNGANPAQGYEPWAWRIGGTTAVRSRMLSGQ